MRAELEMGRKVQTISKQGDCGEGGNGHCENCCMSTGSTTCGLDEEKLGGAVPEDRKRSGEGALEFETGQEETAQDLQDSRGCATKDMLTKADLGRRDEHGSSFGLTQGCDGPGRPR